MNARSVWMAVSLCMASGCTLAAEGLTAPPNTSVWPQWQARLSVNAASLTPVSLVGDYYFAARPFGISGLRATGGVLSMSRGLAPATPSGFGAAQRLGLSSRPASLWAGSEIGEPTNNALPYVGVGFSAPVLKTGIQFAADFGLVAQGSTSGRGLLGYQGLDLAVRELRLAPVLQLGVSYAF